MVLVQNKAELVLYIRGMVLVQQCKVKAPIMGGLCKFQAPNMGDQGKFQAPIMGEQGKVNAPNMGIKWTSKLWQWHMTVANWQLTMTMTKLIDNGSKNMMCAESPDHWFSIC